MSWSCPHDEKGRCGLRRRKCEPGALGCVLEGRVKTMRPGNNPGHTHAADDCCVSERRQAAVLQAMRDYFGSDERRIDHALAVLEWARQIMAAEPGDGAVVIPAAILHDIGIPLAESCHGSAAARFQELEGPPVARDILERIGYEQEITDHVCRIIANHHSARDIDTPEFRIIWDADWLVNMAELTNRKTQSELAAFIQMTLKTPTGRRLAEQRYLQALRP